jgi:hypothetical protein
MPSGRRTERALTLTLQAFGQFPTVVAILQITLLLILTA